MKEIEAASLRDGRAMAFLQEAQEQIILSITSFALYGFPESHAASFGLIAYASAFLKCHYLAAFTAALLNNQPMGFYIPATIVKDAQRHGLKILPIDVTKSDWKCTLERQSSAISRQPSEPGAHGAFHESVVDAFWPTTDDQRPTTNDDTIALRLGLRYVKGLHEEAGQAIVQQQNNSPFTSIHDLARRAPELNKKELNTLAEIGALNSIGLQIEDGRSQIEKPSVDHHSKSEEKSEIYNQKSAIVFHRRDALWSAGAAANSSGPLLENIPAPDHPSPLKKMNAEERLVADFRGTGMTVGPHPMAYHRPRMDKIGVRCAIELAKLPSGRPVRIAGGVIARQRPGTAKGFVFLSLEDETGVSNAIVTPDLFQKNRLLLATEQFLLIEGILQNQDGVISVKAARVSPLNITRAQTVSHDFH